MENLIIIGGGPAGLAAATYAARAGLSPLVFAGSPPGGQLMLTSHVENFPGYESILGPDLIAKMRQQAIKFGARVIDQNITKVNLSESKKDLTAAGKIYTTKTVIIAVGAAALWLNVPGEKQFQGKGVSACATCDGFFFRDKIVAVVGGGDSAIEEALTLTKFAKKVYVIHRRDSFRASKIMQERLFANAKIEVIWNTTVEAILGDAKMTAVKIKTQDSKLKITTRLLKADGLFVAIGRKPDTEIFAGQVARDEKGYIITSERVAWQIMKGKRQNDKLAVVWGNETLNKFNFDYKTATSVPGVFAAGDCVDFQYRQAGVAAGMGIMAALEAERWFNEH